jgi:hypothetical protein
MEQLVTFFYLLMWVAWMAFPFICGAVGKHKGGSGLAWGISGLFVPPWVFIALWLKKPRGFWRFVANWAKPEDYASDKRQRDGVMRELKRRK